MSSWHFTLSTHSPSLMLPQGPQASLCLRQLPAPSRLIARRKCPQGPSIEAVMGPGRGGRQMWGWVAVCPLTATLPVKTPRGCGWKRLGNCRPHLSTARSTVTSALGSLQCRAPRPFSFLPEPLYPPTKHEEVHARCSPRNEGPIRHLL